MATFDVTEYGYEGKTPWNRRVDLEATGGNVREVVIPRDKPLIVTVGLIYASDGTTEEAGAVAWGEGAYADGDAIDSATTVGARRSTIKSGGYYPIKVDGGTAAQTTFTFYVTGTSGGGFAELTIERDQ